jgi:hypothetical protein
MDLLRSDLLVGVPLFDCLTPVSSRLRVFIVLRLFETCTTNVGRVNQLSLSRPLRCLSLKSVDEGKRVTVPHRLTTKKGVDGRRVELFMREVHTNPS